MKRMLLALVASLVIFANTAMAQDPGSVWVFSDPDLTDCNVVDTGGLLTTYLAHNSPSGALAVGFKLDVSDTGWIHLGDQWNFPLFIGTSIYGVSISYQACVADQIFLGSASFLGASAPCMYISIGPDPGSVTGQVEAIDCNQNKVFPLAGSAVVNSEVFEDMFCACTVPVEQTTWGAIKSQYR